MKYIVTINERTAKGKALSAFLKADGVEMKPLKSLNELNDELLAEKINQADNHPLLTYEQGKAEFSRIKKRLNK